MPPADPFELSRFVDAQQPIYYRALTELKNGEKRTHWMWFIFPQLAGLGVSQVAQRYAIASRAEAVAYLAHPLLGARLRECTATVNALSGRTAEQIFGPVDALKFRSSMTLFAACAPAGETLFADALAKYCAAGPDARTLTLLDA